MIEADLYTKLASLVSNRVYPDVAPEGTAKPFITYQQKGGQAVNFLGAESSNKKNARFQINVWSATRSEAATLMRQIEDLMVTSPLYGKIEGGSIATYDEVTKARGAMQDFSFWS
jgi:hypothetical protein